MKPVIFKVTKTPKGLDQLLSVQPDVVSTFYSAVVNVSDSPCATFDYQLKVPSFWFPINEIGEWGYSPFFGTLKVVNEYWKEGKPILIHCHAGANRSPSIAMAIMIAKGYTTEEVEQSLQYPELGRVYKRNRDRKHIPNNIVVFLREADKYPNESLHMILKRIDSLYDTWSQRKHKEQCDCIVDGVRMVYDPTVKKYIKKD